jgi:tetratricopeptide (TPR) repeat protein
VFNHGNSERAKKSAQQDHKGAIANFDNAIKLNATFAEVYTYRGISRSVLGNDKAVIADYDQALKNKPYYDSDGYTNRGNAPNLATPSLRLPTMTKPLNWNQTAGGPMPIGVRSDLGDNPGALADFDKAIELFAICARSTRIATP